MYKFSDCTPNPTRNSLKLIKGFSYGKKNSKTPYKKMEEEFIKVLELYRRKSLANSVIIKKLLSLRNNLYPLKAHHSNPKTRVKAYKLDIIIEKLVVELNDIQYDCERKVG